MRKTISLLLVLIIGMMALTGCGNNATQPAAGSEQTQEEAAAPSEAQVTETEKPAAETENQAGTEEPANAGATVTEAAAPTEPEELVAEFDPNTEYDKYTLVYYIVEDIDARFTATVSAMDDSSQYEVHCNIDGEEQVVTLDKDLKIISDQTGNMSYDAPLIVQKAIDANDWTKVEN